MPGDHLWTVWGLCGAAGAETPQAPHEVRLLRSSLLRNEPAPPPAGAVSVSDLPIGNWSERTYERTNGAMLGKKLGHWNLDTFQVLAMLLFYTHYWKPFLLHMADSRLLNGPEDDIRSQLNFWVIPMMLWGIPRGFRMSPYNPKSTPNKPIPNITTK